MSEITAKMVGELRAKTGAGLMDCKKALKETNGNEDEAIDLLRKKGIASAAKKADRDASDGLVDCYIHMGGKIGVMVEVNCETDFVAKTDDFKALVRDIAMHIAAASPTCVNREDVPAEVIEKEKEIAAGQVQGKPENIVEKIVSGKLEKVYQEIVLLEQPFVKNPDVTIQDLLKAQITKMGENIVVNRFARFQIGA
ncbi:translation elongation factor Ts [Puniceicoccales bacterium CK1056]|uniref:Elongation factor Ts n=2 Tax=Oceanipulchritudo coccoides TaxID=2706888 RepID=A0A6B2LYV3_9BACT|nr:translation elongation factor Ts [Oceanipulchritudo coccoides]